MKYLVFFTILIVFNSKTVAQNTATQYDTCSRIGQYTGTWMYVNGNDTIRIHLRYHRSYSVSFNNVTDNLYGWHEFKQGNTIIESDYQNRNMRLPYQYDLFRPGSFSVMLRLPFCSGSILRGTIDDINQLREAKEVEAILNSSGTTMIWKQHHPEWYKATGMTLPRQFTLIKQP